jgi:hypothetical protein
LRVSKALLLELCRYRLIFYFCIHHTPIVYV